MPERTLPINRAVEHAHGFRRFIAIATGDYRTRGRGLNHYRASHNLFSLRYRYLPELDSNSLHCGERPVTVDAGEVATGGVEAANAPEGGAADGACPAISSGQGVPADIASGGALAGGSTVGKIRSRRVVRGACRAGRALRLAVQGCYRAHHALGAFYRRIQARAGAPKAVVATARKLAERVYRLLKYGAEYVCQKIEVYEEAYRARVVKGIARKAAELGYRLEPATAT